MELVYEGGEGRVRIYCGDAQELPSVLGAGSVTCMIGSPPYNAGVDYDGYDDAGDWGAYAEMARGTARALHDVAAPGCRAWVNVAPTIPTAPGSAARVPLAGLWQGALDEAGWSYRDAAAWVNVRNSTGWGSWCQPSAPNLRGGYEVVLSHFKGTWRRDPPEGMERWRDALGGWTAAVSNVWGDIPTARRQKGGHPAPFPPKLASRCTRLSTWPHPSELVLDPWAGGGATIEAVLSLGPGRRVVGVDVSRRYCDMAAERAERCLAMLDYQLFDPVLPHVGVIQDELFPPRRARRRHGRRPAVTPPAEDALA